MLCERCKKNEATFYYKETVNGTAKSFHLCGDCAKAAETAGEVKSLGWSAGGDFIDDLFSSLFAPATAKTPKVAERKTCDLCGASFEELVREGKAGCPKCYDTFEGELAESIRRIHGRVLHTGGAPAEFREANEAKKKIEGLETALKEAIQSENYERAAELRDELRTLRAAENNEGGDNA